MATTKYGAWTTYGSENVFRVVMDYEVTTNADTTATIKVTSKIQYGAALQQWPPSVSRSFTLVTSVGGSEATTTHTITYTWAKRNTTETLNTRSVTVNKTHAAQSVAVSAYLWTTVQSNPDPSFKYGSLASGTQSVSAKTSYKVTYDANGGDTNSLPATQTKWHGESLTLSSAVPTKSGCTFLGWATTNAGGGTHYQPGASYTGNAALKLYAVWVGVSIETIGAIRCDQDGTEADEGTYGHVDATWRATGTIAGTVAVTARYKATSWSSVTLTGDTSKSKAARSDASGSVASTFGGSLDTDKTYQVQVTATMTYTYDGVSGSVTASMSAYVPYAYITMDFYRGGHGVAFGKTAVREGFDCAMTPIYLGEAPSHTTDVSTTTVASIVTANSGVTTISAATAKTWGKAAAVAITWKLAADVTVPASGNLSNIVVGTLAAALCPAVATNVQLDNGDIGLFGDIATDGTITLRGADSRGAEYTLSASTARNLRTGAYLLA